MTQSHKEDIARWLNEGADFRSGLELYVKAVGKGHPTIYVLRQYSKSNHEALITALAHRAGIKLATAPPEAQKGAKIVGQLTSNRKLRDDFTFLNEPATPPELKILVSNKINSYQEYKKTHPKLFDCQTSQQELDTARHLVENYIENHKIHQELHHFQNTRTILGNHPIFEEMKRLKTFRNTSTLDMLRKERRIRHNIWRIEKLINSKDKPHLLFQRQQKLAAYQRELEQVMSVIGE